MKHEKRKTKNANEKTSGLRFRLYCGQIKMEFLFKLSGVVKSFFFATELKLKSAIDLSFFFVFFPGHDPPAWGRADLLVITRCIRLQHFRSGTPPGLPPPPFRFASPSLRPHLQSISNGDDSIRNKNKNENTTKRKTEDWKSET